MKFSHFNVVTESKFIDTIYTDLYQLIACYDNGQKEPFNSDYMIIKSFTNLDDAIEALKTINDTVGEWCVL